jgi:KilA-N domain
MQDSIIREWNGRTIRQRTDGYLSATDMCKVCNKQWYEFSRSKFCGEYLDSLESITGNSRNTLVETQVGNSEKSGTWVHRKLALRLAQWLNTDFAVQKVLAQ